MFFLLIWVDCSLPMAFDTKSSRAVVESKSSDRRRGSFVVVRQWMYRWYSEIREQLR